MESTFEDTKIVVIKAQDVENVGNLGKYLDKHIAPGHLYIIEQHPNLMATCQYNIRKTMLVFSSKANGAQLLMEAAENEFRANPSKSRKNKPNSLSNDLMVAEKILELEKKPIWIDDSEKLMAINLYARCEKLKAEHDLLVVLMDDYRLLVYDYFHEIPDELKLTMLQGLAEKMGIAVIAQQCQTKETQEEGNKDNNSEMVFHNKWWDDTPKREQSNSIFDYWEP